jgi:chemotaxis protein methyltransferase CheR
MTDSSDARATERFREGIARRLGLHFDESRWGFLVEVLQRRLDRTGIASDAYLERLDSHAAFADELRELARELTVGETYFFRNSDQFRAVAEVVLPERIAARSASCTLSFLSAGCASGEEPYSLAMLAREQILDPRWTVSILGVDLNPIALQKAAAASYSLWSLRETPAETQARWFRPQGRELLVDPAIREAVRLEERNLSVDDPVLFRPETYDMIFCRNVIMYFTLETAQAVVARFSRALVPGGYLFLGHAETLRGLSQDFHLRHTHGTFYYQRRDEREEARASGSAEATVWPAGWSIEPPRVNSSADTTSLYPTSIDDAGSWIDTIRRSSERIQALAQDNPRPDISAGMPAGGATPQPDARADMGAVSMRSRHAVRPDLTLVMESLAKERFAEALGLLYALPIDAVGDPDSVLLRAALLTHSGQLDAAERACGDLLALDELNAGAHYLLALCREGLGDREAAIDHDQVAVYLDPAFAMPRLHMGLLARRAGQREVARRELGLALPLLQREDTSRLLLFGGGFNRDTLTALCRAELGATGAEL